jgi:hypothetical protein
MDSFSDKRYNLGKYLAILYNVSPDNLTLNFNDQVDANVAKEFVKQIQSSADVNCLSEQFDANTIKFKSNGTNHDHEKIIGAIISKTEQNKKDYHISYDRLNADTGIDITVTILNNSL